MALSKEQIKEFKQQLKQWGDDVFYAVDIASEVAEEGDMDWARKIYKKAADSSSGHCENYLHLSDEIRKFLTDKGKIKLLPTDLKMLEKCYKNVVDKIKDAKPDYHEWGAQDSTRELLLAAEGICELGNEKWAREVYAQAIDSVKNDDYPKPAKNYKDIIISIAEPIWLGDKKWSKELKKLK
jgi:rubrerythrin